MKATSLIISVCLAALSAAPVWAQGTDMPQSILAEQPESDSQWQNADYVLEETGAVIQLRSFGDKVLLSSEALGPEVFVLAASPATRGDLVLKNDNNRTMIRYTSLGGIIYYPERFSLGEPAIRVSESDSAVQAAADRASAPQMRMSGPARNAEGAPLPERNLRITAPDDIIARQAVINAQLAMDELIEAPNMTEAIQDIKSLTVEKAKQPQTIFDGQELTVLVNPGLSYAGRPSSEQIAWTIRKWVQTSKSEKTQTRYMPSEFSTTSERSRR